MTMLPRAIWPLLALEAALVTASPAPATPSSAQATSERVAAAV